MGVVASCVFPFSRAQNCSRESLESGINKNKVQTVSLFECTTDDKIKMNDIWFFYGTVLIVNALELYGSSI